MTAAKSVEISNANFSSFRNRNYLENFDDYHKHVPKKHVVLRGQTSHLIFSKGIIALANRDPS